jgi:hypothetical protein
VLPKYVTDLGQQAAMSYTLPGGASDAVGDAIYLVQANNFYTLANLQTPTGTAVGGAWTLQHSYDSGTNTLHTKVWRGIITNATGTVVVNFATAPPDEERYSAVYVFAGAATTSSTPAGVPVASSTSFPAPSCTPGSADDCLIAWYATQSTNLNFTMPGAPFTALPEYDLVSGGNTYRGGYESLSSAAATGTRTATASGAAVAGVAFDFTVSPLAPTRVPPEIQPYTARRRATLY